LLSTKSPPWGDFVDIAAIVVLVRYNLFMNYQSVQFGFTIVELLITIAIISILTAVVIGSLNDAREDGVGAKIKSELVILSKRAKIEEPSSLTYDVVCGSNGFTTSTEVMRILTAIERFSPEPLVCNSDTTEYAVSAAIGSSTYWCVDSEGASVELGVQLGAAEYQCP
jgi:prepilin-type N-terminal cleavage/methylation domain-containing protein